MTRDKVSIAISRSIENVAYVRKGKNWQKHSPVSGECYSSFAEKTT